MQIRPLSRGFNCELDNLTNSRNKNLVKSLTAKFGGKTACVTNYWHFKYWHQKGLVQLAVLFVGHSIIPFPCSKYQSKIYFRKYWFEDSFCHHWPRSETSELSVELCAPFNRPLSCGFNCFAELCGGSAALSLLIVCRVTAAAPSKVGGGQREGFVSHQAQHEQPSAGAMAAL